MEDIDKKALLATFEEELAGVAEEKEKLSKRQSALEKAIAGLRELISLNGGATAAEVLQAMEPVIPRNAFQRKEIVEGAVLFLRLMGRGQTTRQIVNGLLRGGYKTHSKKFSGTVRSCLRRNAAKPGSRLIKRGELWELKEWWHMETSVTVEEQVKAAFG